MNINKCGIDLQIILFVICVSLFLCLQLTRGQSIALAATKVCMWKLLVKVKPMVMLMKL